MQNENLQKKLDRLYRRRRFGIRPGLDVEKAILDRLDHPEQAYGVVHVAGTNGKGSVCALLEAALLSAGYRVGLYTSPHLVRFNERIRVNGTPIADPALASVMDAVERVCEAVHAETGWEPTFFESTTAMGFEYFRRTGVDVALVEVGMGGRLDATNVVTPWVSVLTRISLEHTAHLGSTIQAIATEKSGIIKVGRPVVAGPTHEEAWPVIRRVAHEREAPLVVAEDAVSLGVRSEGPPVQTVVAELASGWSGTVRLPLLGPHQIENLAVALAALDTLRTTQRLHGTEDDWARGIASAHWPGRLQMVKSDPPTVLDGAHNPGAAETLARALDRLFPRRPVALVWGMCQDKDAVAFLRALSGRIHRVWAVPLQEEPERSMPPAQLCALARAQHLKAKPATREHALAAAEQWARERQGVVLVTGSLFLVGEVLAACEATRRPPGVSHP